MDKFEIKNKIEKEFKEISENFVVNFTVDQHIYNQANLILLEHLMNIKSQGLYVSLNKPYEVICNELQQNELDVNAIYCIDCVSKETGKFLNSDRCFCLDDPSSIVEMSVLIENLCNERKIKFIVLDSLSTLLLYNDAKEVEKFAHHLLNRARKSNVSIAIISPKEKKEEDVLAFITQFCDKEIEL